MKIAVIVVFTIPYRCHSLILVLFQAQARLGKALASVTKVNAKLSILAFKPQRFYVQFSDYIDTANRPSWAGLGEFHHFRGSTIGSLKF